MSFHLTNDIIGTIRIEDNVTKFIIIHKFYNPLPKDLHQKDFTLINT